ncbi:MAG: hypothetical protein GXC73_14600 [Chitinophagaceae bacterium]|nr:hypothetical protein [Chitinophagaceae bacterium]
MKNPQLLIILAALLMAVVLYIRFKAKNQSPEPDNDNTRPDDSLLPVAHVHNNKLVLVQPASPGEMERIVTGFCNMYNKEQFLALPRVYALSQHQFAITFPFNINFDIFCYFVNYLNYPIELDRPLSATGWTTTAGSDNLLPAEFTNKEVMIYVCDTDTEADNVYISTSDDACFKISFSFEKKQPPVHPPVKQFKHPSISTKELAPLHFTDYK